MPYRIEFSPAARRDFNRLTRSVQQQLKPHIDALAESPRPPGVSKLKGEPDLYRVRSGDYRVVYQIRDQMLLVLVVRIAHRRDVYR